MSYLVNDNNKIGNGVGEHDIGNNYEVVKNIVSGKSETEKDGFY